MKEKKNNKEIPGEKNNRKRGGKRRRKSPKVDGLFFPLRVFHSHINLLEHVNINLKAEGF